VVTKSVPPYAVVAGCPARVIKYRWDIDTIVRHEEILYEFGDRMTIEKLNSSRHTVCEAKCD
jgi:serine acetyltransferase